MKVAVNSCYGGFSISEEAGKLLKEKGVKILFKGDKYEGGEIVDKFYGYPSNEDFGIEDENYRKWRADPRLIEVIEKLGDKANGVHAEIRIAEVPDDIEWEFDEYDGIETVREKGRSW